MARTEINRSGEMEVFARVVERGGFSAAARDLRMTPSAVSKLVGRLETRLGARLVNRSTRKLQLTPEGAAFYDRSVRVLADIGEAEREASSGETPRGRLRVNANIGFGLHFLSPMLPRFLAEHPEVQLDLALTDHVIDLLDERADVAIRVGRLQSSQLMARKLGESRKVVVASPDYLARHGTPRTVADLADHQLMGFCFQRSVQDWLFLDERGETAPYLGATRILVSDGETMRRLTLDGVGLGRQGRFHVEHDIAAGRLVPVLEAFNPHDIEEIHAVYVGQGGHLPARVRAFIDWLARETKL
ncbi:LysR family transcriptional regulator [Caulobacter mirabilis]|uniref:LysR family transcriptional regulator n=1 Tax=Caulobacter mirabilis TaxID=69666 RepID=A0A2D2ATI6_9CAUL|nr:LysR family transcriptional regulator [Caulobacter mirabilis]ATQ41324.1 LysR family transcriptional regulator [Caulobacter mirabilis]